MAYFLIYDNRELAKLLTIISSQTILFSDFLAQSSFLFMFYAHPFMHQKYHHPSIHLLSVIHTCMLTSLFLLFLVPSLDIILLFHIYFMYSFALFGFSCLLVVIMWFLFIPDLFSVLNPLYLLLLLSVADHFDLDEWDSEGRKGMSRRMGNHFMV